MGAMVAERARGAVDGAWWRALVAVAGVLAPAAPPRPGRSRRRGTAAARPDPAADPRRRRRPRPRSRPGSPGSRTRRVPAPGQQRPGAGTTSRSTTTRSRPSGSSPRRAKDQAFLYAIDRTIVDDEPAPFRTPAAPPGGGRHGAHAAAEHVHAQPARGPGAARRQRPRHQHVRGAAAVRDRVRHAARRGLRVHARPTRPRSARSITDLAAELYDNYVTPGPPVARRPCCRTTTGRSPRPRSASPRSRCSRPSPPQGAPPADLRSPAAWLDVRARPGGPRPAVDVTSRPTARYGEGPYYQRYAGPEPAAVRAGVEPREPRPGVGRRRPA